MKMTHQQIVILDEKINPTEISLIKVDIGSGEEYILKDLHNLHSVNKVPLYVNFHYDEWNDKNLDRFEFLTQRQKDLIRNYPLCSILFDLDV